MEPNKKSSSTQSILIGVIVLQLAVIGYLIYSNNNKKTEIEELTTTIDTKSDEITAKIQEFDSLNVEFERVKSEREALGLNNDSLNAQIAELKQFKANAISSGKINAQQKRKLEELLAKLRQDLIAKDQEIAQLKQTNQELEGKVTDLSSRQAKLGDSLAGVATVKKDLENQLAYASILKTQSIAISALKENGKEFTDDEYKGSKISQLKIKATLADNKAAKQGNRDFLVAIVTPSGNVFSDSINGGGGFTTAEGEAKTYTFKQNINFTNANETVTFLVPKGFNYTAGQYKVIVYSEGYEIGQSGFKVK